MGYLAIAKTVPQLIVSFNTTIANAFGSAHILTSRQWVANSVSGEYENNGSWYDASVFLMNEINVYGG